MLISHGIHKDEGQLGFTKEWPRLKSHWKSGQLLPPRSQLQVSLISLSVWTTLIFVACEWPKHSHSRPNVTRSSTCYFGLAKVNYSKDRKSADNTYNPHKLPKSTHLQMVIQMCNEMKLAFQFLMLYLMWMLCTIIVKSTNYSEVINGG